MTNIIIIKTYWFLKNTQRKTVLRFPWIFNKLAQKYKSAEYETDIDTSNFSHFCLEVKRVPNSIRRLTLNTTEDIFPIIKEDLEEIYYSHKGVNKCLRQGFAHCMETVAHYHNDGKSLMFFNRYTETNKKFVIFLQKRKKTRTVAL